MNVRFCYGRTLRQHLVLDGPVDFHRPVVFQPVAWRRQSLMLLNRLGAMSGRIGDQPYAPRAAWFARLTKDFKISNDPSVGPGIPDAMSTPDLPLLMTVPEVA